MKVMLLQKCDITNVLILTMLTLVLISIHSVCVHLDNNNCIHKKFLLAKCCHAIAILRPGKVRGSLDPTVIRAEFKFDC